MFPDELAGMSPIAAGDDADGGRWEVWLDPHDPSRAARVIEHPPPDFDGMIQLGTFSRALGDLGGLGVGVGSSPGRDRSRAHRTVAAAITVDASRVVVRSAQTLLELTDIGLHPDQQNRLFVGSQAFPNAPLTVTAYRGDSSKIASRRLRAR